MGVNNNIKDFIKNLKNDGCFEGFKHVLELGSQDDLELGDELFLALRDNVTFNRKFIPSLEYAGGDLSTLS